MVFDPSLDTHQASTLDSGEASPSAEPRLVPGLTLLWHPDTGRLGERVALTRLTAGREVPLSRLEPLFAPVAGGAAPRPLESRRLSRSPVHLRPERRASSSATAGATAGAGGGASAGAGAGIGALVLDPGDSPLALRVGERRVARPVSFSPEELDQGVILTLADTVVLLLHRLDPLGAASGPDCGLLGPSAGLAAVREQLRRVAPLDLPVLIEGETGVGKELVARALHRESRRAGQPFVAVDMGALAPSLAAAELFGVERGAFTGADRSRPGLVRQADGGTLFLDEIGEASPEVQVLLLRFLESGRVRSVGAAAEQEVDVRLVAATDADLERRVAAGSFRAPLYHRLAGMPLAVPPLRRRRDDVLPLLVHFLGLAGAAGSRPDLPPPVLSHLEPAQVARLVGHPWPGNVRQVRNLAGQLAAAVPGEPDGRSRRLAAVLDRQLSPPSRGVREGPAEAAPGVVPAGGAAAPRAPRRPSEIAEEELVEALRLADWQPARAAEHLGISRPSLYNLMDQSDRVRTAAELSRGQIEAAREEHRGDVGAMARALRVSRRALARRLGGKPSDRGGEDPRPDRDRDR